MAPNIFPDVFFPDVFPTQGGRVFIAVNENYDVYLLSNTVTDTEI